MLVLCAVFRAEEPASATGVHNSGADSSLKDVISGGLAGFGV